MKPVIVFLAVVLMLIVVGCSDSSTESKKLPVRLSVGLDQYGWALPLCLTEFNLSAADHSSTVAKTVCTDVGNAVTMYPGKALAIFRSVRARVLLDGSKSISKVAGGLIPSFGDVAALLTGTPSGLAMAQDKSERRTSSPLPDERALIWALMNQDKILSCPDTKAKKNTYVLSIGASFALQLSSLPKDKLQKAIANICETANVSISLLSPREYQEGLSGAVTLMSDLMSMSMGSYSEQYWRDFDKYYQECTRGRPGSGLMEGGGTATPTEEEKKKAEEEKKKAEEAAKKAEEDRKKQEQLAKQQQELQKQIKDEEDKLKKMEQDGADADELQKQGGKIDNLKRQLDGVSEEMRVVMDRVSRGAASLLNGEIADAATHFWTAAKWIGHYIERRAKETFGGGGTMQSCLADECAYTNCSQAAHAKATRNYFRSRYAYDGCNANVMPNPESNSGCYTVAGGQLDGKKLSPEESAAVLKRECQRKGGVMHPGPDGGGQVCNDPSNLRRALGYGGMVSKVKNICKDPAAMCSPDDVQHFNVGLPQGQGPRGGGTPKPFGVQLFENGLNADNGRQSSGR